MEDNSKNIHVSSVVDGPILLRVMQLFSANFPLGNFNYSSGLEWAISCGWVDSVDKFIIWEQEFINSQLIYVDFPILQRFYFCLKHSDLKCLLYYVQELLSFRGTCELRMEEQERGEIMVSLFLKWGLPISDFLQFILRQSVLASIAWIGYIWEIPLKTLGLGYSYSNVESNVMTGLKLVPFGQVVAQKLLMMFSELLPVVWDQSCLISDSELGSSFPLQEIASSCHETQYSRMFRS